MTDTTQHILNTNDQYASNNTPTPQDSPQQHRVQYPYPMVSFVMCICVFIKKVTYKKKRKYSLLLLKQQ